MECGFGIAFLENGDDPHREVLIGLVSFEWKTISARVCVCLCTCVSEGRRVGVYTTECQPDHDNNRVEFEEEGGVSKLLEKVQGKKTLQGVLSSRSQVLN